jgi:hypothetical protein
MRSTKLNSTNGRITTPLGIDPGGCASRRTHLHRDPTVSAGALEAQRQDRYGPIGASDVAAPADGFWK